MAEPRRFGRGWEGHSPLLPSSRQSTLAGERVARSSYAAAVVENRSLIERLHGVQDTGAVPGIFRIRPVLVDSSSLVPDVVWSSRNRRPSRFLASVEFGLLRPFAAHHVWAEVPRKLHEESVLRGVDHRLAIAVWLNEYVPRIRVVDVSDHLVAPDHALLGRDASDTPTAALLDLIGPVVVLANDADLVELNLAARDWPDTVAQGYTVTVVALQGWAALFVGRLGALSVAGLGREAIHLIRRPAGRVVLAFLAGALVMTSPRWWPRVRPRLREAAARLRTDVMDSIVPVIAESAELYRAAETAWERRTRGEAGASLEHAVARLLTASPVPLSRTKLASLILPGGSETERRRLVTRLSLVLQPSNAFVQVDAPRWQLGRAGANFGGMMDGAAILDWNTLPRPPFELPLRMTPTRTRFPSGAQPTT